MSLFEIRTGWVGESYVRAYAWACSPEQAKELFWKRNPNAPKDCKLVVVTLMDGDAPPFCTLSSDSGWENV